jgi:hypothetical protein
MSANPPQAARSRYIGCHGERLVSKIVLIGAIPPLMLKTEANLADCGSAQLTGQGAPLRKPMQGGETRGYCQRQWNSVDGRMTHGQVNRAPC